MAHNYIILAVPTSVVCFDARFGTVFFYKIIGLLCTLSKYSLEY